MAELGPLPEVAWAKNGCYLLTNVGLGGKRQRKLGWGHPNPSRQVTRAGADVSKVNMKVPAGPKKLRKEEAGSQNSDTFSMPSRVR